MSAQPPIRPGERARATRIATMLANAVREMPLPSWGSRLMWLRGLALRLKEMRLRPRDLDQSSGQDAIAAIARAMSLEEWRLLAENNAHVLGARWSWIVNRAGSELRSTRYSASDANRQRQLGFVTTVPKMSLIVK